jgi:hypothetical protein
VVKLGALGRISVRVRIGPNPAKSGQIREEVSKKLKKSKDLTPGFPVIPINARAGPISENADLAQIHKLTGSDL